MKSEVTQHTLFVPLVALVLAVASLPALAAQDAASSVSVTDPYVRAVAPGQKSSAAFMKIENASAADHAIVSADSATANIVELHTHVKEDGMMKMRQIESIAIPAGGKTELKPGGLHVMLIDLKQALQEGETVSVTLVFEDGSRKDVRAPVRKIKTKMHHHH